MFFLIFFYFKEEKKNQASTTVHMKFQDKFSLKNGEKKLNVVCCCCD